MALMKDENSDVILLHLYQQEDENKCVAVDIVSVSSVLLVKEPCLKVMTDGRYGSRADHRPDVIHLKRDDDKLPQG
jgi:hypothetical protein